ncbi:putative membrane protein [Allonocardiopsis opalescens]|uniref:Putative membrane protein n=1 Tax=Allonocardiopsis opalescens TaxID=1144618 RepID=A0A2T0Q2F0_9ACTN|nr:putative membrane protein [Allonocardiopsis opalescens]
MGAAPYGPGATARYPAPGRPVHGAPYGYAYPPFARPGYAPVVPAPQPVVDFSTGVHRLHWATMPLRVLVVVGVFLAVAGVTLLDFGLPFVALLTMAVTGVAVLGAFGGWWGLRFRVFNDALVLERGVLRRHAQQVPLSRLQAVDIVRPPLMYLLDLSELRLQLAGGDDSEIRFRYLNRKAAEQLRASLLASAAGLSGRTPAAPERDYYQMPFGLLIGAMALRVPVLAAFALLIALGVAGIWVGEPGVLGGMLPLLLGLIRGFLSPLLLYMTFRAAISPDGLRLRYGLVRSRMQTVPPGRVQAVRIVEPLLWRAMGVARVEANVAGYVGDRQMESSVLLPVAPRWLALSLVNQLFPGTEVSQVRLHRAARPSGAVDAAGIDDTVFVTRRGVFCHTTEVIAHARAQLVRLSVGPWQRLRGTATVYVDSPPGPVQVRASGRDPVEARGIVNAVVTRAGRARRETVGPERWATRIRG